MSSSLEAATPSPRTDAESNQHEEDADTEENGDDVFRFDAPAYYDLRNPALEKRYVNNADGYFTPGAYREPLKDTREREDDAHMSDASYDDDNDVEQLEIDTGDQHDEPMDTDTLSRSLLQSDEQEQSFEEVFAQYASASRTSRNHASHTDNSTSRPAISSSSTLLQPTQAFLQRVHTQHALRAESQRDGAPLEDKPFRLTRPQSPRLYTTQKAAQYAAAHTDDVSRMSYTSRELLQIQEERLRLQLETMRIRDFHARSKTQRPPANVHQRSTKQLTVPVSPYLEVGHRTRRFHPDSDNTNTNANNHQSSDRLQPSIRPETLMSRDFALPTTQHHASSDSQDITRPVPPHLLTAERASRRTHTEDLPVEKLSPNYAAMKVNGVTQPVTPQLLTAKRAHTFRRPVDVVDHDQVELAKKFHAQPVSRRVLAPKATTSTASSSLTARSEKPPLTQPVSPKLSTSARVATRQSAAEKAAAAIADLERRRKERELARQKARPPPPVPTTVHSRGPTIPETPDLKSLRLHRQYQENLRRRIAEEEETQRKQREFKAQPIRIGSGPPLKPEGSSRPLTEVVPFALPGEQFHQRARERLEATKREAEERLQAQTHFRAMPMPAVSDASSSTSYARPSNRPLTRFAAPELASDRRAAERAAFDAAERERRAREDAYKQQAAEEARQRQDEELKALRREKLVFHARPVPEPRVFAVKPSRKPLTEPQSPALHSSSSAPSSRTGSEASI